MPAKDRYHDIVKRALMKAGWAITGELITLTMGDRYLWVDIEAVKSALGMVILVEVKELNNVPSAVEAWATAIGKYILYRIALDLSESNVPL